MKLGETLTQEAQIISELHKTLMSLKLAHYVTTSFAAHSALGQIYDALNGAADDITEKLIGYSGKLPTSLALGTISPSDSQVLSKQLVSLGDKIKAYGTEKTYGDIENLGQEVSGLGAKLSYLSRLK